MSVCKADLLQRIANYFNKPVGFFFDEKEIGQNESTEDLLKQIDVLKEENAALKKELARLKEIKIPTKDSKVYNLWMKVMEITVEMQEMYNKEKKA